MKLKKILNSIWNEFVYGGHLISLGAASIVFTSAILLDIKITWDCLLVVYLGTESVYLYNRFKEYKVDFLTNPERTEHIKKYVKYYPFIIFLMTFSAIVIVVYFNKISALIFGLLLFFGGLLYSKFLKKITKKIVAFKSFFVSLLWTLLVIFLSLYYSHVPNLPLFLILIFVYIEVFVNTSFYDIKDIGSDKKEGLLTLPIVLGQKKMLYGLNVITILAALPILFGFYSNLFPQSSLMLLLTIPYTLYYFQKSKNPKTSPNFLYNIIVDGEFILWSIFILLGEFLL